MSKKIPEKPEHADASHQSKQRLFPIRDPKQVSKERFVGQLRWDPALIPNGRNLAIDVPDFIEYYRILKLRQRIKLKSYVPPSEESKDTFVGGVGKNGEVSASKVKKKIRKPESFKISYETKDESELSALLNFQGVAEYVREKYNLEMSDQRFWDVYTRELDRAFKSVLRRGILPNFRKESRDEGDFGELFYFLEIIISVIQLLIIVKDLGKIISGALQSSEVFYGDILDIIESVVFQRYIFLYGAVASEVLLGQTPRAKQRQLLKRYVSFLMGPVREGKLANLVISQKVFELLLIPFVYSLLSNKPIFKGNPTGEFENPLTGLGYFDE